MPASDRTVTAHIVRTPDGEVYPEYRVGNLTYGSLAALKAALEGC